jgi:hypothetical protein
MGSAVMRPRILWPGGVLLCEFWREERGGGGDFIGGEILDEGLGFRGGCYLVMAPENKLMATS